MDELERDRLIERLRAIDRQADDLRHRLGVNKRNELVWEASTDFDERVIVEADGYGGGWYRKVEDLGGTDRLEKDSQHYPSISLAVRRAEMEVGGFEPDEDEQDDEEFAIEPEIGGEG